MDAPASTPSRAPALEGATTAPECPKSTAPPVANALCTVIDGDGTGKLAVVRVRGREHEVCWRSLYLFPLDGCFRRQVLAFVYWKWFDRFILFLIMVNSILLAAYQYRASEDDGFNWFVDRVLDPVFTGFFTIEFILKVIAWGFFLDGRSYLRELWNWLDFIVVVTALLSFIPGMDSGLGFLRLFRILRPLRSLNALPQMKVLVNTVISSVPRLANVTIMMFFCFWIFGIIGISLLDGIFYHGCRTTRAPELRSENGTSCWEWPFTGDERLCGGRYACDSPPEGVPVGFCGGREDDPNKSVRPVFPGGRRDYPWCEESEPTKVFPETDFVHFDHMGGALLTVFQCMTMEGWTDIMYYVQDGYGFVVGTVYFFTLIPITSFFLLNVALAVVDEAREDFDKEEADEKEDGDETTPSSPTEEVEHSAAQAILNTDNEDGIEKPIEYWLDIAPVRFLHAVAFNEIFVNFIMFFIAANVVTMMLEQFPPQVSWQDFLEVCEKTFLGIFCVEMVIMLGALGPKQYVLNPVVCFDGFIVIGSLIQAFATSGGSALTALRTLRLSRVLNKLANRWPSFRVLLKAMVQTGISLNYWLVLFFLILYIITLMCMSFFQKKMHFDDLDTFAAVSADQDQPWCAGSEHETDVAFRQDCIPRAHFDTFLWALVTVFQIMTGENWNWIMYSAMRAQHWMFAILFVCIIVFGQILFLSLFLSMLMSKFDSVQDSLEKSEAQKATTDGKSSNLKVSVKRMLTSMTLAMTQSDLSTLETSKQNSKASTPPGQNPEQPGKEEEPQKNFSPILPGQPDSWTDEVEKLPKKGGIEAHQPPEAAEDEQGQESQEPEPQVRPPTAQPNHQPPDQPAAEILVPPTDEEISDLVMEGQPDDPAPAQASDSAAPSAAEAPAPAPAPAQQQEQPFDSVASGSVDVHPAGPPPKPAEVQEAKSWPRGYALFVLSETNPIRRVCCWILGKHVTIAGSSINAFDNFILLCILISTVGMALDYPLRDPSDIVTQIIRRADFVFALIFTAEMVLKILALGLIWGKGAYLKSGWNWLDGIVVCVALIGIFSKGSGGFLKTLRILRAFRPLRVISRNQNLKVVVQTIFASLPALLTLVIVCVVFLLIFALFALSYLNGTFYHCEAGDLDTRFMRHLGAASLPLCLNPDVTSLSVDSACPRGQWEESSMSWVQDNLGCPGGNVNCPHGNSGDFTLAWQRATVDTPICVGRCSLGSSGTAPAWLCPRRYERVEELPSHCGANVVRSPSAEMLQFEAIGEAYTASMTRKLVMPCGGSESGASGIDFPASAVSCRAVFCPNGASSEKAASCEGNCRKHPHFCKEACEGSAESSAACASCRQECQAACECEEHCEPLVKDAALCVEQGGSWIASLPQNFNNVWNSLLTLFEISSTEAWVDVMYAACDATAPYEQPVRDTKQWIFAPFFMVYIFFSFMFLLNLSVGVIVDNFMDLKQDFGKEGREVMLTETQQRWIKSRVALFRRPVLFHLTNLHNLTPSRRKVYELISGQVFEATMTTVIVANTVVMASKIYPAPTGWWEELLQFLDYPFTVVFTLEFVLKYYALRRNYWKQSWNCFDFLCVAAAICGVILHFAAPGLEFAASITQLFRIFRIARLFRLLRSKRLNTIFTALVLSLPKLANVLMILLLLLVLYSILAVSLFSTAKHSEYLNQHGNFEHFGWAFITLFRAVTGEAWNSIMHDLLKGEKDFFEEGSWCAPDGLYDASTEEKFAILNDKCLIRSPNSCVQTIAGWNFLPAAFWTTYILIICLMVMNLVIAVILEGYADGHHSPEDEVIEICIHSWRKYDKDQKMTLPLKEAMRFIYEAMAIWMERQGSDGEAARAAATENITLSSDLSRIPMKSAKALQITLSEDGRVDFLEACKQVLRFTCVNNDFSCLHEIQECENMMDKKQADRIRKLEARRTQALDVDRTCSSDLTAAVAAVKLQRYYRMRVANTRRGWVVEEVK